MSKRHEQQREEKQQQEPLVRVPLIQVASQRQLEELSEILGLTFVGTTEFDAEHPEHQNVPVVLYTRANKQIGVLYKSHGVSMCTTARQLNEHRVKYALKQKYKRIVSVEAHSASDDSNRHHPLCRYLTSVEQVERYLQITVANPERLQAWFAPRLRTPQRMMVNFGVAAAIGGGILPFFGIEGDINDYPTVQPAAPKKLKLDQEWDKLLKPKDQLKITECPELQCGCCCTNQKTIACVPCGDVFYCDECFRGVLEEPKLAKTCPLCRKEIDTIIRVNL